MNAAFQLWQFSKLDVQMLDVQISFSGSTKEVLH